MMDSQIYGTDSTMASTFETKASPTRNSNNSNRGKSWGPAATAPETEGEGSVDVDIDLNLLKNLLDSHAMSFATGMTGESPAAALLAQYGVAMPAPPLPRQQPSTPKEKNMSTAGRLQSGTI